MQSYSNIHGSEAVGDDVAREVVAVVENGGLASVDGGRLGGVSGGIVEKPIRHALERSRTSLMAKISFNSWSLFRFFGRSWGRRRWCGWGTLLISLLQTDPQALNLQLEQQLCFAVARGGGHGNEMRGFDRERRKYKERETQEEGWKCKFIFLSLKYLFKLL